MKSGSHLFPFGMRIICENRTGSVAFFASWGAALNRKIQDFFSEFIERPAQNAKSCHCSLLPVIAASTCQFKRRKEQVEREIARGESRRKALGQQIDVECAMEAPPQIGEQLDGYKLSKYLSRGGFGDVYLATDSRGRQVVLKVALKRTGPDSHWHDRAFEMEAFVLGIVRERYHGNHIIKLLGEVRTLFYPLTRESNALQPLEDDFLKF